MSNKYYTTVTFTVEMERDTSPDPGDSIDDDVLAEVSFLQLSEDWESFSQEEWMETYVTSIEIQQ